VPKRYLDMLDVHDVYKTVEPSTTTRLAATTRHLIRAAAIMYVT
jgi:hypothetical protein